MAFSRFFFEQIEELEKRFEAVLTQHGESSESFQAGGAELFNKYGVFNIIDQLAGGDVLKWDEVLKIECATVLIKLCMEADKKEFQRRLGEVLKKKQKK